MIHPILSIQAHYQSFIAPRYKYTWMAHKIRKYRNAHQGEICFILGNGPSLSPVDLDKLADKHIVTFATNRIYNIFPHTHWRPTYYVCEDPHIIREKQAEIRSIPAKEKFIPVELKWYHDVILPGALFYHENDFPMTVNEYGFSPDIAKEIVNRGTVTFACMEIAAYMGFSEIYLLGVDHNYQVTIDIDGNVVTDPNAKDYFCEGYDDDIKHVAVHNMGQNTRAYLGAKGYCDTTGKTAIYNATRGGKLEVFDRVSFDDIVK